MGESAIASLVSQVKFGAVLKADLSKLECSSEKRSSFKSSVEKVKPFTLKQEVT
jgi:hypothetical protein